MEETGKAKPVPPLKEALRSARIEAAERTAVIVDLRDAEMARLEILNEALAPVFADVSGEHRDLFDRGISAGASPRLWIDMIAHVAMGRDKRTYRFMQDTIHGRRVLAEAIEVDTIVAAVTRYVARRLIAREQLLAGMAAAEPEPQRTKGGGSWLSFLFGIVVGGGMLIAYYMLR